jgi:hypothetical protein
MAGKPHDSFDTRWRNKQTTPFLPVSRLDEYRIEHQLSLGGFSIVYLATDGGGQFVAIKEYLPNSLACAAKAKSSRIISKNTCRHSATA